MNLGSNLPITILKFMNGSEGVIKGFTAGEELPIVDKPDQCSKIKEKLCYLLLLAREQINEYDEASEAASLLNTYDAYIMSAVDNAFKKR